jgi:hypothetical protein
VFAVRGAVDILPVVGWTPLHPPDAVQLSAPLALHVKVADWPIATVLGVNCKLTVGFTPSVPAPAVLINGSPSPQAASAVMAASPRAQRNRRQVTGAQGRSRSPWAPRYVFNLAARAMRRLRAVEPGLSPRRRWRCSVITCTQEAITSKGGWLFGFATLPNCRQALTSPICARSKTESGWGGSSGHRYARSGGGLLCQGKPQYVGY